MNKMGILQGFIITNKYLRFKQFNDEYIVRYGEFHLRVHLELTRNANCVTINLR